MEASNTSAPSENRSRYWLRVLRPLFWWLILVLVLYGIRTHQRLMENTRLTFSVSMQGQAIDANAAFDGKPAYNGQNIPLGKHTFVITHPKGESYSTNMFIWYGEHNFGTIDLTRKMGTLKVTADPPADRLIIRGPEWSVTLTNSSGLTQLVPTDTYEVEAEYPHWQKRDTTTVFANQSTAYNFAPHFGGLQLGSSRSDATFQLQLADGRLISSGSLPVTVAGLPAGDYKVFAVHHRHQRMETLTVKADTTTTDQFDFNYGAAVFETIPNGAAIITSDGQNWGLTPLALGELLPGNWSFTLQRNGYQSVQVSLVVTANQTNFFSTNLVSENYLHALNAARQYLTAADYDSALRSAGSALALRPDDPDALSLQREAVGLGYIQRAKALGKSGEYIEGGRQLTLALQSLPDNVEAKQLVADFKQREPEEIERLRVKRMERPKKTFDTAMWSLSDTSLFETHELKTTKPAAETRSAIVTQLTSVQPIFKIIESNMNGEIFKIEATQDFSGGQRHCAIVGGQSQDDETQIFFKVVELKKVAFYDQPITALVGAEPAKYTVISPLQAQSNEKIKAQIAEGVSSVTARIQSAIGQTPAVQPAPSQSSGQH